MTPVLETPAKTEPGLSRLLVFGALILLCYAPAIVSLAHDWMNNEDMGHGFFVPIAAGYVIWQQREELKQLPERASWWGFTLVLLGAAQSILATLGVELFLARSAMIVSLAGAVWTLGGPPLLRRTAFPLFLLCFMVPLPAVIFNSLTFRLQILATQLAAATLNLIGIPVMREGNILELPTTRLSVVEACSGIRSLLSLSFLSLVYGYFCEKRLSVRVLLFLATIPIAILANAGRVTITGVLSQIKPELAEGFFHESTGWVIFMLALGCLLLLHLAIGRGLKMADAVRARR